MKKELDTKLREIVKDPYTAYKISESIENIAIADANVKTMSTATEEQLQQVNDMCEFLVSAYLKYKKEQVKKEE